MQALLDLGDRLARVEALGARLRAVHDRLAPVQLVRVVQRGEALGGVVVAAVDHPAVRLQQHGGAEVLVLVPPVGGAAGAAAGAQDALVEAVELGAALLALKVLGAAVFGCCCF